ncbi:hypothetical protein PhaeoP75_02844 [Phaeobacter gallaeciensis]|uniref:Uncharacterized protein n=1 Tax=Phaeobacter gallaeciensis TaxID=60890 RepID=A0AAD0EDU4_9RHOB|nr:hypothetical protein Gal_02805 [Phaeobacter gallaeciensis DSM 26640]ATE93801.1 hypothetical protein PhaeoP11_02795 [Phaeobacter gallaeciensis]ATE96378.1 hypothetical protein PhaeoP73_01052 [Phaeobacter gallaeciensis]ATF02465.1 hypothetical protein PhaeoP75_02844 [Phaeobacter gallaeciensis]ATF06845.1 hypothetical protein PhaeoP63_02793 [Phaeobacter gallaeciensis]
MALASAKVVVVAIAEKMQRRGRYEVLELTEMDGLVTDATLADAMPFANEGVKLIHVHT